MAEAPLDPPITLDQLRVFLCVVEEGSFSRAARRLRRVQSTVSYSIATLERLLDVELFDRAGRLPRLTAAGRALVAEARAVTGRVDRLQAHTRRFAAALEPRVTVAFDPLIQPAALRDVFAAFEARYPSVALHPRPTPLGDVAERVRRAEADLGIGALTEDRLGAIAAAPLLDVPLAAVCAPAYDGGVEVVLVDGAGRALLGGRLGADTHAVGDLASMRERLRRGDGWGIAPLHAVRSDLDRGALRERDDVRSPRTIPVLAIHRAGEPPGPAAAWLLEALRSRGPGAG